jgi:hypothetical protein
MNPRAIAVGDVNGDGRLDVVVANADSNTVCVLAGNAVGSLDAAVAYSCGGTYPLSIAIGDVTGDGRPDVVVANTNPGNVCVLAGNAGGTLSAAVSYPCGGSYPASIAIGDVTGDGRLDVVVSINSPNAVCVLAGNAAGTLDAAVAYAFGTTNAGPLAIGDVTGDGRPDVVVANPPAHAVTVLAGNAAGTLDAPVSYPSGGHNPYAVAIGDINGDGLQDVVVTDINANSLCVLRQNANGTLTAGVNYPTGAPDPYSVAIADLNGDLRPDVIVVNMWSDHTTIGVLTNQPGGWLLPAVSYLTGGVGAYSVAVGDVTGDGRTDVVTCNTNTLSPPVVVPGSVCVLAGTYSGALNAAAAYDPGAGPPHKIAIGDVNGDRRPDVVVATGLPWICVLTDNADGTLNPAVSYVCGGNAPTSVAIGDVTQDDLPDVVTADEANTVCVLAGNAGGTLDTAICYPSGGTNPTWVAIGDMNGDGMPDVIVANNNPSAPGTIGVLAGNASGGLDAVVVYPSGGNGPVSIAVGDVTGDGRPDVIVANAASGMISVLAGNASGTLDAAVVYPSGGSSPVALAVADLNRDGRQDVVVANGSSPYEVSVLTGNAAGALDAAVSYAAGGNWPVSIAIADLNGDGRPDVIVANKNPVDTVSVLAGNAAGTLEAVASYASDGFGPYAVGIGDLNGDGRPDAVATSGNALGGAWVVAVLLNQYSGTSLFSFCDRSNELGRPCPCGNNGLPGHGCQNSAATGGAQLSAIGTTNPDTVALTSSGELPSALSIVLQGTATVPYATFGDGLRCVAGQLKRLYVRNASNGSVSAPRGSDPSITARSAALGDPIFPGSSRFYQVYYRDPAATFCPPPDGNSWNVSNALRISW